MPELSFVTLDVFTATRYEGNPLAVVRVPAGVCLSQTDKQTVASEFNFSETVFLHENEASSGTDNTFTMDIFTTIQELPFAGHPTVGAAHLILHGGHRQKALLQVQAGPIPIELAPASAPDEKQRPVRASVPHDVHVHSGSLRAVLHKAGIAVEAVVAKGQLGFGSADIVQAELDAPIVSFVKGMAFLLVQMPSLAHLALVQSTATLLDVEHRAGLLDEGPWNTGLVGRFYYCLSTTESEEAGVTTLRARMIAENVEDPATGSASCALASFLTLQGKQQKQGSTAGVSRFKIVQGVEMGRRSVIAVDVQHGAGGIESVFLGGTAVEVTRGVIFI